jgi:(R,R)-butanediol dehydrogenase / meso-butanediol dehydrogenase / diacetyl reductase
MKGVVVVGDHQVKVIDLPQPEPGHGQVLVRAVEVGVCGSDCHPYRGPLRQGAGLVQGHELSGVVEAIGTGVEHVNVGDRVVAYQAWGCGYCEYCARGWANLCTNRYDIGKGHRYQKDYSVVPEAMALPLPAGLTFDDGVMLSCAGGTAWSALQRVRPSCDDVVAVFGLGPVGLMGVMWARAMGAYVVGVEVNPERLALGSSIGAHVVVDASSEDAVERIRALTGSRGASVAFESSGSKAAQEAMLACSDIEARLVYVAVARRGPVIEASVGRGGNLGVRSVNGTFTYSLADWYAMARAIRLHDLKPGSVVTHRFPIELASEAYRTTAAGHCGKVVFEWR